MKQIIELELTVETDVLRVAVVNTSEQELRFWARSNSWGWSMFSLLLALPGSDEWKDLTAKQIHWTRNVPRATNVLAGGRLDYELRPEDPEWNGLNSVEGWMYQPFQVRVRLCISETPEAVAQEVFIGEAHTPPCLSKPPHSWLTGQAKGKL